MERLKPLEKELLEKTAQLFCQSILHCVVKPALNEIGNEELTDVQLTCLRFVRLHPDPSVGEIAEGLNVSNAASAKLIDRLVKKGLLTREEDQRDRRVLKIKLTQDSEKLLNRANEIQTRQFQDILSRMSAAEVNVFESGLISFINAASIEAKQIEEICLRCGWDHVAECPGNAIYRQLTGKNREKV